MPFPIFNTPSHAAQSLELLRKHLPQALEADAQVRILINAAALQLAVDPANHAGVQIEEDGFELRWVGKREAHHSAFVPVQKIMEPRLLLAKDLVNKDRVIFLSIDDNEQAQLKLLCDDIFGQENSVGNIIWKNVTDNNPTNVAIEHENILCYAKDKA